MADSLFIALGIVLILLVGGIYFVGQPLDNPESTHILNLLQQRGVTIQHVDYVSVSDATDTIYFHKSKLEEYLNLVDTLHVQKIYCGVYKHHNAVVFFHEGKAYVLIVNLARDLGPGELTFLLAGIVALLIGLTAR